MTKKTQELDEEILKNFEQRFFVKNGEIPVSVYCLVEQFIQKSLQKKEQQMLELFKGWLEKEKTSVCSKHKINNPYCDICGSYYGFNECLAKIKQKAKEDGFII